MEEAYKLGIEGNKEEYLRIKGEFEDQSVFLDNLDKMMKKTPKERKEVKDNLEKQISEKSVEIDYLQDNLNELNKTKSELCDRVAKLLKIKYNLDTLEELNEILESLKKDKSKLNIEIQDLADAHEETILSRKEEHGRELSTLFEKMVEEKREMVEIFNQNKKSMDSIFVRNEELASDYENKTGKMIMELLSSVMEIKEASEKVIKNLNSDAEEKPYICKICYTDPKSVYTLKCGHLIGGCCLDRVTRCPWCKEKADNPLRIYIFGFLIEIMRK